MAALWTHIPIRLRWVAVWALTRSAALWVALTVGTTGGVYYFAGQMVGSSPLSRGGLSGRMVEYTTTMSAAVGVLFSWMHPDTTPLWWPVAVFAAATVTFDAAITATLVSRSRCAAALWLAVPVLLGGGPVFFRADIAVVATTGVALWAARRRRPGWAGAAMSLSTLLRLGPAAGVVSGCRTRVSLWWFTATTVLSTALSAVWYGWARTLSPLTVQRGRGIDVTSVPALAWQLSAAAGQAHRWVTDTRLASLEIPPTHVTSALSAVTTGTQVAAVTVGAMWMWWTVRTHIPADAETAGLAVTVWVLCADRVLTGQYLLWTVPFLAAIVSRTGYTNRTTRRQVVLFAAVCILTQTMVTWGPADGQPVAPWLFGVAAARSVTMLTWAVYTTLVACRPCRTSRQKGGTVASSASNLGVAPSTVAPTLSRNLITPPVGDTPPMSTTWGGR